VSARDVDWDALRTEWARGGDAASAEASAGRQMVRARRAAFVGQVVEAGIAATGIALVGLALLHAANPLHAMLGLVVGAGIGGAWLWPRDLTRQEQSSFEASASDNVRMLRAVRHRQAQAATFIWIVIALDLVFLIPWWVAGSRVHARSLTDPGTFETVWLPLFAMMSLALWAARSRSRARHDLAMTEGGGTQVRPR
jgi:hypothetical protein